MTRTGEVSVDVQLSRRERAALERIVGAEVEAAARLVVLVKVKAREKAIEAKSPAPQRRVG